MSLLAKIQTILFILLLQTYLLKTAYAVEIPHYDLSSISSLGDEFNIAYIQAPYKDMDPDDIEALRKSYSLNSSRFYVPSVDADHWFVLSVENSSDVTITKFLRIDEAYFSEVSLFYQRNDQWNKELNGLKIPLVERKVSSRYPTFLIKLEPFETRKLYLKLNSNYYNLTVGLHLESGTQFYKSEQKDISIYAAYLGATFIMLVYNLFLYLYLKEKIFIYYVIHGLCFSIFVFLYSSFDLYFGVKETTHYIATTSIAIAMAFLILFAREMLETQQYMPKLDRIMRFSAGLYGVIALLILMDVRNHQYLIALVIPTTLLLFTIGAIGFIKNIALSKFYILGSSWHLIGLFTISAINTGLIHYSPLIRHFYLLGSLIELTLFSCALAYKIKQLQEAKILSQQLQIKTESQHKQHLEQVIAIQTDELNKASKNIDRLAIKDSVTFLNSRQYFNQHLDQLWKEGNAISLLFCDIDYFTAYNQSYGYPAGDQCLIQVADVIESAVTDLIPFSEARLCSRFAGGKFAVILPELSEEKSLFIAQEIATQLAILKIPNYSKTDAVSLSFGTAQMTPFAENTPEDLIQQADIDLTRNKSTKAEVAHTHSSAIPQKISRTSISTN